MKMSGKGFGSNLLNLRGGGGLIFNSAAVKIKRDSLVCSITEYWRVFVIIPDSIMRSFV